MTALEDLRSALDRATAELRTDALPDLIALLEGAKARAFARLVGGRLRPHPSGNASRMAPGRR